MKKETVTELSAITNMLCMISTKGQDTIVMGLCLSRLNELTSQINAQMQEETEKGGENDDSN